MNNPRKLMHNIVIVFIFVSEDYTLKKGMVVRQSIIVKASKVERK